MSNILEIRDLRVSFGGIRAVDGISFDVEEGKIVTLIGANGAGKSTILRSIAGITKPQSGKIVFSGSDIPRLKERSWQLAGTLSGGEQQMLAVGRALMSRPRLIMMDEPSLGLAPLIVKNIFEIIKTINNHGITVLLIEQNANMALKIAHTGYVIETGHIIMSGTGAELLADERVKEAYLGKTKH